MKYDKALLKDWCETETWDGYLERNGAYERYVSTEGFKFLEQQYFREVKRRIRFCKRLLATDKDWLVFYTLAELSDRDDLNKSPDILYKKAVRYYCLKAIHMNPDYAPLWALLSEAYEWIALLGGERNTMPLFKSSVSAHTINIRIESMNDPEDIPSYRQRQYIENAIKCMKRALTIEPVNLKYSKKLEELFSQQ